jgi:hypothetical protein
MRKILAMLTLLPCLVAAAPRSEYQPLAFLAGHCWKGEFPDGKITDEHCFSWIYGGKFLRDQHTVRSPGKPDALGESIYFWDANDNRLEYLYIESDGGSSRGPGTTEPGAVVGPDTNVIQNGKTQVYRSRWQPSGANAYDVLTEFKGKDGWVPGFKVHMDMLAPAL